MDRGKNSRQQFEHGIRLIRLDEALSLHAQPGTLFIDSRHAVAFQAGSIPGALNLARTNFERDYAGKEGLFRRIICCDSCLCGE